MNIFDNLSGCKFFSTFDLKSGFYQVSLIEESSEPLTVFQVRNYNYEFNIFPFGVRNAPTTFQRMLQLLFSDITILPYIDDIVVASRTFSDHLQSLQNVFLKLRGSNLKLNVTKCKFAEASVVYLGHLVSFGAPAMTFVGGSNPWLQRTVKLSPAPLELCTLNVIRKP